MSEHNKSHLASKSLSQWLSYLENLHPIEIDLGLERIKQVADKLQIDLSFSKVITVAGTNGKGTTCAFIENAILSFDKSVAVYSSPHIEHFNERLRFNKQDVDDDSLVIAFERIEAVRGEISLSYYEYTTLAAFIVLMQRQPQYIILEVGLGGRLDATNIIDCDVAVITSIDIDHQQFLGNTRELIGFEKAGIMRDTSDVVVGDPNPPNSLVQHAQQLGAPTSYREQQFSVVTEGVTWQWRDEEQHGLVFSNLANPHIPRDNVATAIAVLVKLGFELSEVIVNRLIDTTRVAGRTEMFSLNCDVMLDVGHNPHAARFLANKISSLGYKKVHAVVGMLADKDVTNVLAELSEHIAHWYIGTLAVPRAADANTISQKLPNGRTNFNCFDNIGEAFKIAYSSAKPDELILVFGSFFTVAEIRKLLV